MSRKSSPSPPVAPDVAAKVGKRRMPWLRASPARSGSWFLPVRRSSKASRSRRVSKSYEDLDPTLLDEMALINATPLGVDEVTVPVGVDGLQQDWFRVGESLRKAMGAVSEEEQSGISNSDQGKR